MRTATRALWLAGILMAGGAGEGSAQCQQRVPAVSDAGAGPTTWVLVTGIVGGVAGFRRLEARLLAAGDRVIIIDPYNLSVDSADVTFDALARRVDRVLEEKGITGARIVGHERGAGVVLHLAAADPRRARELFFLDAGALSTNASAILSSALRIVPLIARVPGGRTFIRTRLIAGFRENAGSVQWLDEASQRAYTQPFLDDIDRVVAMALRLGQSREPAPVSAIVARIRVPILVIIGDVPHAAGPREPELTALLPLGNLVRIEHLSGVGLFPHEEAPDTVATLLLARPLAIANVSGRAP